MPVFEVTVVDTYKVFVRAEHRAEAIEFTRDNLLDIAEHDRRMCITEPDPTYGFGRPVVLAVGPVEF